MVLFAVTDASGNVAVVEMEQKAQRLYTKMQTNQNGLV